MHAVIPFTPAQVAFPHVLTSRPADRHIMALRAARIASGLVLAMGGLGLVVDALAEFPVGAAAVLQGAWLVAAAAFPLAYAGARIAAGIGDPGRALDRWLTASLAWPIGGLAAILPLTLHALVVDAHGLDQWVAMSLVIVGHCHVALALMGARRAQRLVNGERAMPAAAIYGVVVGIAMVPGALLLLVPPVLVAATGLPFLFILWVPERIIAAERAALAG